MARPVVPVRVRGRVVRVDVARTGVGTIGYVATATHCPHHVRIDEVGVNDHFTSALQSRLWKIIAGLFLPRILLEENYVFRNFFFMRRPLARPGERGGCGPLCRLRGIHPYWTK